MPAQTRLLLQLVTTTLLLLTSTFAWSGNYREGINKQNRDIKTCFVIEMVRNGASSQNYLTHNGRIQGSKLGAKRYGELRHLKEFVAVKYNPNAFLSLTLDKPVNSEMAKHYIQAMYPLDKMKSWREQNYITKFTPIKGTAFENMVNGIYYSTGAKVCVAGQHQVVPSDWDTMACTETCPNLHLYMKNELYDEAKLESLLID